jgi:F-type H+-transporting ATPase subunit delta
MYDKKLAQIYAKSLFEIAKKQEEIVECYQQLFNLNTVFIDNNQLIKILTSPIIGIEKKYKVLEVIVANLNLSTNTGRFLKILVDNKRFGYFSTIYECFHKMYLQSKGELEIELIIARQPGQSFLESVTLILEKYYGCKINLKIILDETIIDGLVLSDGTLMYDCSIANKLQRLKQLSSNAVYSLGGV